MGTNRTLAVVLASLLVCSVLAPSAVAAASATAANAQVSVDTEAATDVAADGATLNGNVTELNGSDNATVSFEYWAQGDADNSTTVEVGNVTGPGTFSAAVSGLDANTTYVYVAKAEANGSAATGGQETFTTLETLSVSVETENATNVTEDGATLNGNLTDVSGAENASVAVRYWEAGDRSTTTVVQLGEQSEGNFSVDVSGLDANTTYTYVALAEAERGNETADDSGSEVEFTTDEPGEPLGVQTDNASDVTNSSATLNGELTGLGGADNATVSFEYWQQGDQSNASETTGVELDSAGSFSAAVSDLDSNTTYVYVAQADNGSANVTGERVEFTTRPDELPLGVQTNDASDVTNDSATLNGELTGLGGADSANVSFEYWVDGDADNSTTVEAGGLDAPGTFSAGVSGLQNNTTYVYVAHAEANGSNVTGDQVTFTPGANETNETEDAFEPPEGPFGHQVVAFIDYLRSSDDVEERNLGRAIASWVTENNPGNAPDHAGPKDDGERGPPDHAGPDGDKERGPPEDKERGPPEDRGPDRDDDDADEGEEADDSDDDDEEEEADDSDDDDEEEEADDGDADEEEEADDGDADEEEEDDDDDDDERGPPEGKGPN